MDLITENTGKLSSRLVIDLEEHIYAYKNLEQERLKFSFAILKNEIANSQFIFDKLITQALQYENEETINIIKLCPAHYYVQREFAEILKNAIDGKLKQQENAYSNSCSALLILEIKLELDLSLNNITIKISDNGAGFTEEKLELIQNKAARESSNYYNTVGSEKYCPTQKNYKTFMLGGAGRGLRELMSLIDKGDATYGQKNPDIIIDENSTEIINDLAENQTVIIPRVSILNFYNKHPDNSAVIEITTSLEPIVFNEIKETKAIQLHMPKHAANKHKKPASPETAKLTNEKNDYIEQTSKKTKKNCL